MHQQQQQWPQDGRQPIRDERDRADRPASHPQNGNAEEQKKHGRMTAEERRALRRQINEAGRDLYTPHR